MRVQACLCDGHCISPLRLLSKPITRRISAFKVAVCGGDADAHFPAPWAPGSAPAVSKAVRKEEQEKDVEHTLPKNTGEQTMHFKKVSLETEAIGGFSNSAHMYM